LALCSQVWQVAITARRPRGPVESVTELIEDAGAFVIQIGFKTNLLDALSFRLPGLPPLIFMNSEMPGDRYRYTLAHELAHLILHNQPETDESMESQAVV
jgi:Zn-dependent peptidase ImmA (M78 family)